VDRAVIGAAIANMDAQPWVKDRFLDRPGTDDLHLMAHDTETQAPGQIDAPSPAPAPGQGEHRRQVGPAQAGLRPAGPGVHLPQHLGGYRLGQQAEGAGRRVTRLQDGSRLRHRRTVERGSVERGGVKTMQEPRPVSLERGQDVQSQIDARVARVQVRGILVRADPPALEEIFDVFSPHPQQGADDFLARSRHAPEARQTAAAHEVQRRALYQVIGRVRHSDEIAAGLTACRFEKLVAQRARAGLRRSARHRHVAPPRDELDADFLAQRCQLKADKL
jgi:hypothetical protein